MAGFMRLIQIMKQNNSQNKILFAIIYAVGAFVLFSVAVYFLKFFSGQLPVNNALFGVYTRSDIALSLAVAIVVTLSRVRKWKLRG